MEKPTTMNQNVRTKRKAGFQAQIRRALQALPQEEALVAALYFVGELPAEDIAHELDWPLARVERVRWHAFSLLRKSLLRNGFHAEVASLTHDAISDAVCTEHSVPKGLFDRILDRIDGLTRHEVDRAPTTPGTDRFLRC